MNIPVFHDDQHGTAITVAAAMVNALKVAGKNIAEIKLVASGAGAAALACLNLLLKVGLKRENVFVTDIAGVVYEGRTELMDEDKAQFAQKTDLRTLSQVIEGADAFLGLSAGNVLKKDMVAKMAATPIIFALANPNPEILPEDVQGCARRCHHRHRPHGLPQPGQQRSVLPLTSSVGPWTAAPPPSPTEMEIAAVHAIASAGRGRAVGRGGGRLCGQSR